MKDFLNSIYVQKFKLNLRYKKCDKCNCKFITNDKTKFISKELIYSSLNSMPGIGAKIFKSESDIIKHKVYLRFSCKGKYKVNNTSIVTFILFKNNNTDNRKLLKKDVFLKYICKCGKGNIYYYNKDKFNGRLASQFKYNEQK